MYYGYKGLAMIVFVLVVSTFFLTWISAHRENPVHRFGKVIGWIAVVISLVVLASHLFLHVGMMYGMKCPMMKKMMGRHMMDRPMMMEEGGRGMDKKMKR